MNYLILLLILVLAQVLYAENHQGETVNTPGNIMKKRGEFIFPWNSLSDEELDFYSSRDMREEKKKLKKIKYYLLNGELRLASEYLSKLSHSQSPLRPTIYRYLAILSFIEGNYEKTDEYLSIKELQNIPEFGKICLLKTLTEIVLNRNDSLKQTWSKCYAYNARDATDNYLIWPEMMVEFKLRPQEGMTRKTLERYKLSLLNNEDTKIILKIALYLNQEEVVLEQIPELNLTQLQDSEIRELVGQIYFRKGNLQKSYLFIEDLTSPNAINIVGNLHLMKKNYEKAFDQFKQALKLKPNSQNALERILPLAWILGDWESAFNYAYELPSNEETMANKLTLLAAFSLEQGDYEKSEKYLQKVVNNDQKGERLQVTQLGSFLSIMQKDDMKARKYSWMSCQQNDLINCWLLFQFSQWENFSITITRKDKFTIQSQWQGLKEKEINQPLQEKVYISQKDIEELDDKLIELLEKK
jgi:tetratricopeptide (TPR) repeat protein